MIWRTFADGCRIAGIFLYRGDHAGIANCHVQDYSGDGRQTTAIRIGKQAGEVVLEHNTITAATALLDERN